MSAPFYGNITDFSNLHFQFDAIFSSRAAMDRAALLGNDNIFAGRFVLIKYDNTTANFRANIISGFLIQENNSTFCSVDKFGQEPYVYTTFSTPAETPTAENWDQYYYHDTSTDTYFKLPNASYFSTDDISHYVTPDTIGDNIVAINTILQTRNLVTGELTPDFYKCNGSINGQTATWTQVILDANYQDYFVNYQLDLATYGTAFDTRGYDATVWQKVYSDGHGSFIPICHLNSSAPAFELYPEKPSFSPTTPYIDGKSTEFLYRIHTPSLWGLQFKEAEPVANGGLSEQQVTFTQKIYSADGTPLGEAPRTIDADIYMNQAGSNIAEHCVDTVTPNEILLTDTGSSGRRYFKADGTTESNQNDILELSIHMPIVGNMVAHGYDLIYGYETIPVVDTETEQITGYQYPRNTDISWVSGEQSDNIKLHGTAGKKTHDLTTLAGTINTMHDRLGQIIIPLTRWLNPEDEGYNNWIGGLNGQKYIYSYQTAPDEPVQYYRLTEEQIYTTPETGTFKYVAVSFEDNLTAYSPNSFYYLTEVAPNILIEGNAEHNDLIANLRIDGNGTPNSEYYYYKKSIADIKFTPVTLEFYRPGIYYLKDGTSYICDNGIDPGNTVSNSPVNPYGQYYTMPSGSVIAHTFYMQYEPNKYYYQSNDNPDNYILATEEEPNGALTYYTLSSTGNNPPVIAEWGNTECLVYQPNTFYYTEDISSSRYMLISDDTLGAFYTAHPGIRERLDNTQGTATAGIYWLEFDKDNPVITGTLIDGVYQTFLSYPVKTAHRIDGWERMFDYPTDGRILYYEDVNGNYIKYPYNSPIDDLSGVPYYAIPRVYHTINPVAQQLYIKGRYYKLESNGDYNISWDDLDTNISYYTIRNVAPVVNDFYMPNKYWYEYTTDDYRLDTTAAYAEGHTYATAYFVKQRLYVESDSSGRCPVGFEWNEDSVYIPASVVLKSLVTKPILKEMVGVANGESSINGTILQLQQEYDPESKTRDLTTFRGGLNKLQDLLYTIDQLIPGRVVYVNEFGQLTTGDLTYQQLAALV